MKALHFESVVLEGIRPRKDKSLSITLSTPEMTSEGAVAVWDKMGVACDMLLQPSDDPFAEIQHIKGKVEGKPLHVRLRATLWVLATKKGLKGEEAEQFYRNKVEGWIEAAKEQIAELDK